MNVTFTAGISLDKLETAMQKAARRGLRDLANDAFRFWKDEAGKHLKKTLRDYRQALDLKKIDEDTYQISLHHSDARTNFLVTAIEVGVGSFDIKKGLLASDAAKRWSQYSKRNPGGKKPTVFLDVPFRTRDVKTQSKPDKWRRLTQDSSGWQHPGFRPLGTGRDLGAPYRDKVKEHLREQFPKVIGPLLARLAI